MGATFDMNKIRDAHQARTLRVLRAMEKEILPGQPDPQDDNLNTALERLPDALAAALMELAKIWREEAQAFIDAEKKKQGWKGTSDKLFQSASDVAAVAVAIRNHGLPTQRAIAVDPGSKGFEKGIVGPITVIDAGQNGGIGYIIDPRESITPVAPEEFTGEPEPGPKAPIAAGLQASTSTPAPGAAEPTLTSPGVPLSDDPAGDFLRDLGKDPSRGDFAKVIARGMDLPVGVIVQPRQDGKTLTGGAIAGEVVMNSGKPLDASSPSVMTVSWKDGVSTVVGVIPEAGIAPGLLGQSGVVPLKLGIGGPEIGVAQWSIGTADAPPAWTRQPPAVVYELSDDPATWLPSPDHTSVSQANLAGQCAMKWWLSKRRGASERPGWSLVGGKALHSVIELIERLLHEGMRIEAMDAGWVLTQFKVCFDGAILDQEEVTPDWPRETWHAAGKGKEDESWWRADGPEMVHHYLAWRARWVAQGWQLLRLADQRVAIEHEFLAFIGGNVVKGYIDSIWINTERRLTAIIDWKSGSTVPPDYFQQATYAIAAEQIIPAWPVAGAFWDARKGELTGPLVDLAARHPRAEVEMRLSAPRRIDAAGLYIPNVEGGYGGCNSCSLKRSCPVGSRMGKGEIT